MVTFEYQGVKFTENELCWAINQEIAGNRYWAASERYQNNPNVPNRNKMDKRWGELEAIYKICGVVSVRNQEILAAAIKLGMRKVEQLTKLDRDWADSILGKVS